MVTLPRTLDGGPAAPGDVVLLDGRPPRAVRVTPRSSELARGASRGGRRVIAANADLLLVVVAAADPAPSPAFIDRYLVAGELGGLRPELIITKLDLPHEETTIGALHTLYADIGYHVEGGSAVAGDLADRVLVRIGTSLAVLAGHSGVGKSTLTTVLTGEERATGAVSGKARTGRHTTTDPRLIALPSGGGVIDTAGVRTFQLPPVAGPALAAGFPEIAAAARGCRFADCLHAGDQGCAVEDSVASSRLESYRALLAENA